MHAFPSGMAGTRPGVAWEETYTLSVFPELVIQRILRHANVSTTATYYIKTAADDVRKFERL
jgi:integrase